MRLIEKVLESEKIFSGRIVNLRIDKVLLPDGTCGAREVVEHKGAVGIVALDENLDLFLVRQYRIPANEILLEIPAGRLEMGEDPLQAAKRELEEEAGSIAGIWEEVFSFYSSPGFCNEKLTLFLASELSTGKPNRDKDEFLEPIKLSLTIAYDYVKQGKIIDAKSIIGIQYAYQRFYLHSKRAM